jgi:hypothetical protein
MLSLLSGILIIRFLPLKEYAWYTIANTMLGTLTLLSDGGISLGVMSEGANVWQDKKKLGIVLITGISLRKKFALVSLLVSVPILLYLLVHQKATWFTACTITLFLIPAFYAALSDNLLEIPLKLHQEVFLLQKNQFLVAFFRFLLTCLILVSWPITSLIILASGLTRIFGNIKLKKFSKNYYDTQSTKDSIIKQRILNKVRRVLPESIFYCLAGQLNIFLISFFGKINSVAQIGALGRLTIFFSVVGVVFNILIIPRFARAATQKIKLAKLLLVSFAFAIGIVFIFILGCELFSTQILLLLGREYHNLKFELILSATIASLSLLGNIGFGFNASKGWIISPVLTIPISIISFAISIYIFDISTLTGVLYMGILTTFIQVLLNNGFLFWKIIKIEH